MSKTYATFAGGVDCARFKYHGIPRVIRVISFDAANGNVTGYETRNGKRQINKRYARIKTYKLAHVDGRKITLSVK